MGVPTRRTIRLALLAALGLSLAGCSLADASGGYPYEVFEPPGNAEGPRPLLLFLHGAGGLIAADDPVPGFAAGRDDFPFLVVRPRTDRGWDPHLLADLLDEVEADYRVAPDRVYVTGLSMGAYGAWRLAGADPGRFAAIALVAGGGDPALACRLAHVPLWAFHNAADPVVPASESQALVDAVRGCGGEARLTVYEEVPPGRWAHNAWQAAYTDPALYAWLLEHRRPGR